MSNSDLNLFVLPTLFSKGVYVPTLVRQILDHSKEIDLDYDGHSDEYDDKLDKKKKKKTPWSLKDVRRDNAVLLILIAHLFPCEPSQISFVL